MRNTFEICGHQYFLTQAVKLMPMVFATPLPTGFPKSVAINNSQHHAGKPMTRQQQIMNLVGGNHVEGSAGYEFLI